MQVIPDENLCPVWSLYKRKLIDNIVKLSQLITHVSQNTLCLFMQMKRPN